LASYDQAIALRPDYADAHFLKGLSNLVTGDFERGWAEYEWRRKAPSARLAARDFPKPIWLGEDDIAGKTILLHSEQGLGDSIQFCRYVPLVAARGARVTMEVEGSLLGLMTGLAGRRRLSPRAMRCRPSICNARFRACRWHSRLGCRRFPRRLRICACQANPEPLGRVVGAKRSLRIGLAWAGNAKHVRDRERSMLLRDMLPLLDIDATFVSLQKEVRAADAETLASCNYFGSVKNSKVLPIRRCLYRSSTS